MEPYSISDSYELRRIKLRKFKDPKTGISINEDWKYQTDFFEYYWAHLMHGNRFGHVIAWLFRLAARKRDQVPPSLVKPWRVLQAPLIIAAALLIIFLVTLAQALLPPHETEPLMLVTTAMALLWVAIIWLAS